LKQDVMTKLQYQYYVTNKNVRRRTSEVCTGKKN